MKLQVTPSELEGLAHGLSGLLGDLELAGDVRSISSAAAENAELQAAIERLVMRWTEDLHDVHRQLRNLTGQLDNAGVEYDRVERTVTHDVAVGPPGGDHALRDIEAQK